ncbi:Mitochondrial E3 ubiquitin protein ligase 1 [Chionoecetes opilio]|uniref:RING-type E3 ubiquitin transferase n=1 Tax=Chionoecetes opilio TaxID=41210 RepID=A0A8J4XT09_CHIOP|nr:Mitochondrial E3 ubiquitin protein ligase 1 [Chionoecetes opilio]
MPLTDHVVDILGVGVSASLTFSFYYLFRTGREIVHHLKEASEVDIEPQLMAGVAGGGGGLDACVRGVVRACDNPIHSLTRPEVCGVFWRHTIKEHLTSQVMGFWLNDSLPVSTSTNSVPFMLMRKGVGVQITDPGMLEAVDLTIVNEKFDAANTSFVDHVWGWMKGVRTTGTQHTEEMLVEGTSVLGIGRLVLGAEGLCLDPSDTVPYMITTRTKKAVLHEVQAVLHEVQAVLHEVQAVLHEVQAVLHEVQAVLHEVQAVLHEVQAVLHEVQAVLHESLVEDLQAPLPYFRALGVVTALGGLYCVVRIAVRMFDSWKRRRQRQRELRLLEEARARQGVAAGTTLGESDLPESLMCVVCCGLRDVLLLPCRHMCVCGACAFRLPEPRACPVCRTEVESVQPVYYS